MDAAAPADVPALPDDALLHVMRCLAGNAAALGAAACVSRAWRDAAREPAMWRDVFWPRAADDAVARSWRALAPTLTDAGFAVIVARAAAAPFALPAAWDIDLRGFARVTATGVAAPLQQQLRGRTVLRLRLRSVLAGEGDLDALLAQLRALVAVPRGGLDVEPRWPQTEQEEEEQEEADALNVCGKRKSGVARCTRLCLGSDLPGRWPQCDVCAAEERAEALAAVAAPPPWPCKRYTPAGALADAPAPPCSCEQQACAAPGCGVVACRCCASWVCCAHCKAPFCERCNAETLRGCSTEDPSVEATRYCPACCAERKGDGVPGPPLFLCAAEGCRFTACAQCRDELFPEQHSCASCARSFCAGCFDRELAYCGLGDCRAARGDYPAHAPAAFCRDCAFDAAFAPFDNIQPCEVCFWHVCRSCMVTCAAAGCLRRMCWICADRNDFVYCANEECRVAFCRSCKAECVAAMVQYVSEYGHVRNRCPTCVPTE